jgi:lysophospholipase L1-like esterase
MIARAVRKSAAVAFGIVAALLLFVTAEAMFRLFEPSQVPSAAIPGNVAIEDPVTGWRLRPDYDGAGPDLPGVHLSYRVRINHAGFRGPALRPDKPTDVVRIAALGDSVTFGFGVAEEDTYPVLVASALSSSCRKIEAINAGVPGFTSLQGVRYLDRVLSYHPDIVTVLYGWNDGWRTTEPYAVRTSVAREIVDSSRMLTRGRRATHALATRLGLDDDPGAPPALFAYVPPEKFEMNLLEIADAVRRAGAIPVLVTAPAAFGPDRPPAWYFKAPWMVPRAELESTWRRYADVVREVAANDAIPFVDGARLVPDDPSLFLVDAYHPNARGQRALADQIVNAVQKLGPLASNPY